VHGCKSLATNFNTANAGEKFCSFKTLYADGGFDPVIKNNAITLGAEQLAVVGFNAYADDKFYLGRDESVQIPQSIIKIDAQFNSINIT